MQRWMQVVAPNSVRWLSPTLTVCAEESYPSTYLLYGLSVELGARILWNRSVLGVKGVFTTVYVSPSSSVMYTLLCLMSVKMS